MQGRRMAETGAAIILAAVLLLYLAWPSIQEARRVAPHRRVLVVYAFSILGPVMNEGIFPVFSRLWKEKTGEQVVFTSSFAGSGTITNQIILGAPAAVAILSHEGDAGRLKAAGAVRTDWREFPAAGVVNHTPFVILVRKGNPKRIRTFADLTRPGVELVHPDPLTSGGAAWAILAEFASAQKDPGGSDPEDRRRGVAQLRGIWKNVVAQAPSAMGARTQFEHGFGDALITYEQQAMMPQDPGGAPLEMVMPPVTVLSEHRVVLVDRNIRTRDRFLAISFLDFLFSREGQAIFVRNGFRSAVHPELDSANRSLHPIPRAITVGELGGWDAAYKTVVEEIWKGQILKELGR